MRYSQLLIPTMKEDPADAQVASHRLMVRAGMIRKVTAGVYNYLPLGLRVIQKISQIIREEMNKAGAQEILMPFVQPAELWQETGRWDQMGPLLARFKDARGADFCLGPTHEEVVTDLVRREVKSYRQLPINLYQIQTKFRDEIRPRFGLMRGREFLMKDAYSFGRDQKDALDAYDDMFAAYQRIFTRCGLHFCAVEADTGAIGGNRSHEFQVLADTGEDAIASCNSCGYAANVELAEIHAPDISEGDVDPMLTLEKVHTPSKKTIADVSAFLGVLPSQTIKSMAYMIDGEVVLVLCRGDHEVNEIKLKKALGAVSLQLLTDANMIEHGLACGFVGPINLTGNIRIYADLQLKSSGLMVVGANEPDHHFGKASIGRDFQAEYLDLKTATTGDLCGRCGNPFVIQRGIEVGHVFYLGTKYSKAMNASFLGDDGKDTLMEMGCYGLGVSRTAAAAVEQNHDENGIIWPMAIAPFQVSLVRISSDEESISAGDALYKSLILKGVEVLYDDRDERPGVKFKDNDLIGCPLRITIGGRSLKEGLVELKSRSETDIRKIALAAIESEVVSLLRNTLNP